MSKAPTIPTYTDLLWPTLRAVRELGGSGSIDEIVEKVTEIEGFTEEQQSVPHGDGPRSEIEYRLAWSRTYLKGMGALDNSARGVWTITENGLRLSEADVEKLHAQYKAELRAKRRERWSADHHDGEGRRGRRSTGELSASDDAESEHDWKEELLEAVLAVPPDRFERLAQRLLREAGFISATVMGRSVVTAGSTAWASTGSPWSASRSSFSASGIAAVSGRGCTRFSRRNVRPRRQGLAHHHGELHERCQTRGDS